ncbi:MAG: S-layer homology domain-containing protein, partial [Candidatus Limnocylindrales bacterium]
MGDLSAASLRTFSNRARRSLLILAVLGGGSGAAFISSSVAHAAPASTDHATVQPAFVAPPPAPPCVTPPFSDVLISHPFCPEIQWMKDNGISTGFGDGTYRPTLAVSRQAMSAFMARLAGANPAVCSVAPFSDVSLLNTFCKEIRWMRDNAISTGFGDGTYRPAIAVTRQAMSAFMARLVGATPPACAVPPFTDVPLSNTFCKEIQWMRDNGISTGFGDGTYRPSIAVTRQAMSAFMYRVSFLVGALPVVTTTAGSIAYTEDGPTVVIDNALTVTDADSPNMTGALVSIASGLQAGDTLTLVIVPPILSAYDPSTGVLTLTGSSTLASYQAALRTITFHTTNNTPTTSRTIEFKVKDNALYSDPAYRGITITPNNDAPIADDETFNATNSAVGNTTLVVNDPTDAAPSAAFPKKSISGDILDGDTDVDGPGPLTVSAGTFSTTNGGSVTIEADGDFVYVSDPGDLCVPTSDAFNYTVNDGGSPNRTDIGQVTIALSGCVWYVSNNAPGNAGSSTLPFDTLAQAQTASAAGHTIFIFDGDNTTLGYSAGITLKANQRLLGEDVTLVVGSDTLWTATANRPTITDLNADVVELAAGNEVRGLQIDPAGNGGGIAGGAGDVSGTIDDVRIIDTLTAGNEPSLELTGTTGTWNISNLTIDNTGASTTPPNTAKGVALSGAGTVNFLSAGTISIAIKGAAGLDAANTNMGTSVFDAISVTQSTDSGVRLVSNTGTTTLGDGVGTDLNVNTSSGAVAALLINSGGSVNVAAAGTDTVSAIGGPAIAVTNGSGVSELSFESVSSSNSAGDGISLSGMTTGTFSSVAGSISGAAGTAFVVTGGSGNITYPGAINDGTGTSISISARTGGAIALSGAVADGADSGGGISLTSNSGGTTTLSNASQVLNTGTGAALLFNSSDGHTLTLSGGGLDIDTTSGKGIEALNSGTLIITGASNSIGTGAGTPLNVVNTDIGAGGLNFVSISSGAALNGIVLNSTGLAAGLTVTGDGGSTVNNTGGSIVSPTGSGISLTLTRDVVLDQVSITNAGGHGIVGNSVTNFSLTNSVIAGAGDGANEYGIFITNLLGTGTMNNDSVTNSQTNNLKISNTSVSPGTLTVTNSVFTTTDVTNGGDA